MIFLDIFWIVFIVGVLPLFYWRYRPTRRRGLPVADRIKKLEEWHATHFEALMTTYDEAKAVEMADTPKPRQLPGRYNLSVLDNPRNPKRNYQYDQLSSLNKCGSCGTIHSSGGLNVCPPRKPPPKYPAGSPKYAAADSKAAKEALDEKVKLHLARTREMLDKYEANKRNNIVDYTSFDKYCLICHQNKGVHTHRITNKGYYEALRDTYGS